MQCNYNSFIQIINFHALFRYALRCRKTGACRILVPLRYVQRKLASPSTNYDSSGLIFFLLISCKTNGIGHGWSLKITFPLLAY